MHIIKIIEENNEFRDKKENEYFLKNDKNTKLLISIIKRLENLEEIIRDLDSHIYGLKEMVV